MATIMSQGFGRGGQGSNQRCDATCHKAQRPKCVCICRGRYHGRGSSESAQQQLTKDWLGEDWVEQVAAAQRAQPGLTKSQAAFQLYERRIAAKEKTA